MAQRGQLTKKVQELATRLLGYEIDVTELRLMPYIQYCAVNSLTIDPTRINEAERAVLSNWRFAGYISGGAGSTIWCTLPFWRNINEIVYLAYIDNENQTEEE